MVIKKALQEEDSDKRLGFANAVAYYMKLAYNNWHKEIVHDDAIQAELSSITDGQLTFTNTPYVRPSGRRTTATGTVGLRQQRQKFQHRNGGGGGGRRNDNRGGNGGNFKKRDLVSLQHTVEVASFRCNLFYYPGSPVCRKITLPRVNPTANQSPTHAF